MAGQETHYARNADGDSIAYQVIGDGPIDLVFVPGFVSHVELSWAEPSIARFLERLASFTRLVIFDKRGTGLSDPVPGPLTLEARMDDVHAVMDAAGSERAALLGLSEGAAMSVLFAATYPERVSALVLCGSVLGGAHELHAASKQMDQVMTRMDAAAADWGSGGTMRLLTPSADATDRQLGLFERSAASPRMATALLKMWRVIDIRDILPTVRAPTLVLHRSAEIFPIEAAREIANCMPGANFVELEGRDHTPWTGDAGAYVDEIEDFLTGARTSAGARHVLSTVLFTDIVDSTARAASMGDKAWSDLLARHDELVRRELRLAGGREVKHTGDGFLAAFDGPARAIGCARSIIARAEPDLGLKLRAGVHTGECELAGDDLRGMAVHVGARVAAAAGAGEVLVSGTVKELVLGSGLEFEDRGTRELKGVPGQWRLYRALDGAATAATGQPDEEGTQPMADRAGLALARRSPALARLVIRSEQRAAGALRNALTRSR